MSDQRIPLNHDALSTLLSDPVINKIIIAVNTVSLSMLELLEYGVSRKDVNRAIAKGVLEFAKPQSLRTTNMEGTVPETGDYYFEVLSTKIRLTGLGLYILEILEDGEQPAVSEEDEGPHEELFRTSAPRL